MNQWLLEPIQNLLSSLLWTPVIMFCHSAVDETIIYHFTVIPKSFFLKYKGYYPHPFSFLPSHVYLQWLWGVTSPWRESGLNGKVTTQWLKASCGAREMSSGTRRQRLRAGRRSGMRCVLQPVPLKAMITFWLRPSWMGPASLCHTVTLWWDVNVIWGFFLCILSSVGTPQINLYVRQSSSCSQSSTSHSRRVSQRLHVCVQSGSSGWWNGCQMTLLWHRFDRK